MKGFGKPKLSMDDIHDTIAKAVDSEKFPPLVALDIKDATDDYADRIVSLVQKGQQENKEIADKIAERANRKSLLNTKIEAPAVGKMELIAA